MNRVLRATVKQFVTPVTWHTPIRLFAHTHSVPVYLAWLNRVLRDTVKQLVTRVTRHTPIRLWAHAHSVPVYLACLNRVLSVCCVLQSSNL